MREDIFRSVINGDSSSYVQYLLFGFWACIKVTNMIPSKNLLQLERISMKKILIRICCLSLILEYNSGMVSRTFTDRLNDILVVGTYSRSFNPKILRRNWLCKIMFVSDKQAGDK